MSTFTFSRRQFILSCLAGTFFSRAIDANASINIFSSFSFAFISDCHLTSVRTDNYMLLQESQLFLQDVIKQLNVLKPDFVLFGGDQTQGIGDNDANWQLFLDIVQGLECPWYFVLGETDVSGYPPVNKVGTFGRDWKGRGIESDSTYWSVEALPGIRLIGLDTSQAGSTIGNVDQAQLAWLEESLKKDDSLFTIVFSHHPLLEPQQLEGAQQYLLPQADMIRTILEKSQKKVISLSGHMHVNNIQWHNNIWYILSPSLDVYPCSFRLFKVLPEKIDVRTYQVNFPALVKKAKINLQNSNLAQSFGNNRSENFVRLANGGRNDQNVILSLKKDGILEVQRSPAPIR